MQITKIHFAVRLLAMAEKARGPTGPQPRQLLQLIVADAEKQKKGD
jgi:hypothetical protein